MALFPLFDFLSFPWTESYLSYFSYLADWFTKLE